MNTCLTAFTALTLLLAGPAAAGDADLLPAGAIARSQAGPADELIGFLLFDPQAVADALPPGLRWRTLEDKARGWPRLRAYLDRHPERRGWAWSVFELIGIHAARYDDVEARFDGGRGGMAVWYPEVQRSDTSDPRPRGEQLLALGSWVSDDRLVEAMRTRGFPARHAHLAFEWNAHEASAELATEALSIRGRCRLEGPPFTPDWAADTPSLQTVWTPADGAPTFEVVSWAGHRARRCVEARWQVSGSHAFARLFNDPAHADAGFLPTEFAYGYWLQSALYPRREPDGKPRLRPPGRSDDDAVRTPP